MNLNMALLIMVFVGGLLFFGCLNPKPPNGNITGNNCTHLADCPPGAAACVNGKCTEYDSHGCVPDGGYVWCDALQKCIQPWVENCTAPKGCATVADCPPGAARCVNGTCTEYDEHGCVPDGGYTWCEAKQKCIRPWEENCTNGTGSGNASIANPASVYCTEHNGTLTIVDTPQGQVGMCNVSGQVCEEWAYMRGQCNLTQ